MVAKVEQEPLLGLLPAEHSIFAEPVAPLLGIRPSLVSIWISRTRGSEVVRFKLPAQWTSHEAGLLIHEIRGLAWQLDENNQPTNYAGITDLCEQFLKRNY